jgi:hypothetical protein
MLRVGLAFLHAMLAAKKRRHASVMPVGIPALGGYVNSHFFPRAKSAH